MTENKYPFDLDAFVRVYENNPQAFALVHVLRDEESGQYTDFEFVYANAAYEKMSGFRRDDLIGHRYFDIMDMYAPGQFEANPQWNDLFGSVAYGGAPRSEVVPGPEVNSEYVHYFSEQCFQVAEGYCGLNSLDITPLIEAREAHRKAQEAYLDLSHETDGIRKILDSLPGGVIAMRYTGDRGTIVAVNDYLCDLLEVDKEDFLSFTMEQFHALLPEEDQRPAHAAAASLLRGSHQYREFSHRMVSAQTNTVRWFTVKGSSYGQPDGTYLVYYTYTDITAVRQTRERERELSAVYESVFDTIEAGVFRYDITRDVVEIFQNRYKGIAESRYGLPPVYHHPVENIPPIVASISRKAYVRLFTDMKEGMDKSRAFIMTAPTDGNEPEMFQFDMQTVQRDEGGAAQIAIGIAMNITDRWHSMGQYREEKNFYPNARGNGLFWKGHLDLTEGRLIEQDWRGKVGESISRFGKDRGGSEDSEWYEGIIDENHRGEFHHTVSRTRLISAFKRGQSSLDVDFPCVARPELPNWMRLRIHTHLAMETGHIECFMYAYDATKEHLEEEMLSSMSYLGYRELGTIDLKKNSWVYYSYRGRNGESSARQEDYSERQNDPEVKYMTDEQRDTVLELASPENIAAGLERGNGYFGFVFASTNSEGKTIQVKLGYCWLDEKRKLVFYFMRDVTEEVEREQARLRELEEANYARLDFIYRLNHDIRTPIGIIRNMLDFAREDIDDRSKLLKDLDGIESGETFLLSLINDVMDISAIDQGKVTLERDEITPEEYEASVTSIIKPLCEKKGLQWRVDVEKQEGTGKGTKAVLDKARLNQIHLNLIGNAVKYTKEGHVNCTFRCARDPKHPDDLTRGQMTFIVEDTGIGMSSSFQEKMFDAFTEEMENPLRTADMAGTGLGLSIVKRNVDLMGGTIEVESAPGKGTKITVRVPHDVVTDTSKKAAGGAESVSDEAPLSGTILVAEDNDMNRIIVQRMVEHIGLSADLAVNGKEAVEAFESAAPGTYSAILMDVMMPVMGGYDATRAIRVSDHPDAKTIPVIGLTASAFREAQEEGMKAGMTAYLTKPVNVKELKEVLKKYIQ